VVVTDSIRKGSPFIEDILDGMYDWVRVVDFDNNILYMNRAMIEDLGIQATGKKCYEILGRSEPCINCISRKAIVDGVTGEKEEEINGRTFSVMSSPLRNAEGKVIAAVEVLRETTQIKKLYEKTQEQNDILKKDLEMARKLQSSLLPGPISDPRVDLSLIYMPCESLGGDFVDIFCIDDSHIGIYIADASGHGVQASLLTVFLRSALDKKLLSPSKALEELYREFNRSRLDDELYISVFYAIMDLDNKTLLYSNAGLNVTPVVYSENRFELLRMPGIPISSWMKKPDYKDGSLELLPGDRFFLYTDGILEMKNSENEQFGEERLLEILLNGHLSPRQTLLKLKNSAFSFAGIKSADELQDDVTMALFELK
jgi:sigma-B regulation protein RsbU (phosphoserine phosphatase)